MSDEIKVNSENAPRKNLATLGQVKDALDKRDEKIDSIKEDIGEIHEGNRIYHFVEQNVDCEIDFANKYSQILKVYVADGKYSKQSTTFALQYRKNNDDKWTDIIRIFADIDGNYRGTNEYVYIPNGAQTLRIVSHNNANNNVKLMLYCKNNILEAGYRVLGYCELKNESGFSKESITQNLRLNLKAGKSYHFAIYAERDGMSTDILTCDSIKLFDKVGGNFLQLAKNRYKENIVDLIYDRWNYFAITPTFNISILEFYISALENIAGQTAKIVVACKEIYEHPIGYLNSYAKQGIKFLKETCPNVNNISVGRGNAIQALKKISDEEFITFKSIDGGTTGTVNIIKNSGYINNRDGWKQFISYEHTEFLHVINVSHLNNGNLLVASKISDENRYTYEYDYKTNNILNVWTTPKTDPANEAHLSQFVIPVNGKTDNFYIGYSENANYPTKSQMKVYIYKNGELSEVGNFNYLPKYTQDTCVFDGRLYIIGNDGYRASTSFITIVDISRWEVVDIIEISNTNEMEGIDIEVKDDIVFCYTSGNTDTKFIRTFLLS